MVTGGYWILLHDYMMSEMKARGMDEPIMIARQILIHSVPFICVAANVILSRIGFNPGMWRFTLFMQVFYITVNSLVSLGIKHDIYYFLPWNSDISTALFRSVGLTIL